MSRFQPKRFSPAVEKALAEVYPSDDPIDSPDFDPVAYLNERFPDEASLTKLPEFHNSITTKLRTTESQLLRAIEVQATSSVAAAQDLQNAQTAVKGLSDRVAEIQRKASANESTVKELCQNIQRFDTAKSNLTQAINTLRSMQLWMLQLQTLSHAFARRSYVQCRDALREVLRYSHDFAAYADIPKVKELNDKQTVLVRNIDFFIRTSVIGDNTSVDETVMSEACAVIDVLGEEYVKRVREKFIEKELEPYRDLYRRGSEDARLERVDRRYRRFIADMENKSTMLETVFPKSWFVPQELGLTFCLRTRDELDYLLKDAAGAIDVGVLTFVLQKTMEFEKELTTLTNMAGGDFQHNGGSGGGSGAHHQPVYKFHGMLLGAFKSHLGLFVKNENRMMEEALAKEITRDEALEPTANLRVGTSMATADDIFVFIKQSLRRTLKVSQQTILLDMAGVWRKHLISFAQMTQQLLPTPPTTMAQFRKVCVILNTAETCQTTSLALGEEVAARSECSREDVSFNDVTETFFALYSAATAQIVAGVDKLLQSAMLEFSSGAFLQNHVQEDAQDESDYVRTCRRVLAEVVTTCADVLPTQVLRFVLDKIAISQIPKYAAALFRLRQPSPLTITYVRVDSTAMERIFLALPNTGQPDRYTPAELTHYIKIVRREFDRMTRTLKLLQVDAAGDSFVDLYYTMTLPDDRSILHFQRVTELKGLALRDIRPWIVALNKKPGVPDATPREKEQQQLQQQQQLSSAQQSGGGGAALGGGIVRSTTGTFSSVLNTLGTVAGTATSSTANNNNNNNAARGNATVSSGGAGLMSPTTGTSSERLQPSSSSSGESGSSMFGKVVKSATNATQFLNNLKDRATTNAGNAGGSGNAASPQR